MEVVLGGIIGFVLLSLVVIPIFVAGILVLTALVWINIGFYRSIPDSMSDIKRDIDEYFKRKRERFRERMKR